MQKWEYLVAVSSLNDKEKWLSMCNNKEYPDTLTMINSLGEDGWELASTTSFVTTGLKGLPRLPSTYTYYEKIYFKRPKS